MRPLAALPAFALVLALAAPARAFVRSETLDGGHDLWWPTRSVPYVIQEDCAVRPPPSPVPLPPAVAAAGEDEATYQAMCHAAVERSFRSWQDVGDVDAGGAGCTDLELPFAGDVAQREVGYDPTDPAANTNLVLFQPILCEAVVPQSDPCWQDDSCDGPYGCFSHGSDVIALTTTTYQPSNGMLLDADIEVNDAPQSQGGFDFSAETGAPIAGTHDVQNTITHEAGHFIGLAHNCLVPGDTGEPAGAPACTPALAQGVMFADETTPEETTKRTLKPDDVAGICHIYPRGIPTVLVNLEDEVGTSPVQLHGRPSCATAPGPGALLALLAALVFGWRARGGARGRGDAQPALGVLTAWRPRRSRGRAAGRR